MFGRLVPFFYDKRVGSEPVLVRAKLIVTVIFRSFYCVLSIERYFQILRG